MPRCNIREENPAKYAQVKAEQEKLRAECSQSSSITLARLCPYCGHKIEILSRGTHGYAFTKCPNCGENVGFPPVSFRFEVYPMSRTILNFRG